MIRLHQSLRLKVFGRKPPTILVSGKYPDSWHYHQEKDMQKNREIMDKLMKDKDHEMSEVLTAAQYEKYLKRREDMRKSSQQNQQSRGGGFDGPPGGGGGFSRGGGSF